MTSRLLSSSLIVALAAATPLLAVSPSVLAAETARTTSPSSPSVSVVRAAINDVVQTVVFTGTLVAREEVLVSPEVEGLRIVELLADEGDEVSTGQVLARLDRQTLEIQLAQNAASIAKIEASLVDARNSYDRTKTLQSQGNAAPSTLDKTVASLRGLEADLALTQAQRRDIELKLARTEIKAQRPGVISRRTAKIGQQATSAGEPLFRIIANSEIELEAEIIETRIAQIRKGAKAIISVSEGKTVHGKVRLVPSEVDKSSRLGKVRIALDKDPVLRIGAFGRGTIEIARSRGVTIPLGALVNSEKGARVQVVVGDKVETRQVKIGIRSEALVEIVEGLTEGDMIVLRAGSFLRDGDQVRPVIVANR